MDSNPLLEMSKHSQFQVPIYFDDDQVLSYKKQLINHFTGIIDYLDNINADKYGVNIKENVIGKVHRLQVAVLQTLDQYLEGHPAEAYKCFAAAMDDFGMREEIHSVHQFKVERQTKLFRIQRNYDPFDPACAQNGWLKKNRYDLFHPAFERRRAVRTTRFSISGYPCLYLSENLVTSYSECFPDEKDFKGFHAVSFLNNRPMYFLDMSRNQLTGSKPNLFGGVLPISSDPEGDIAGITESLDIFQLILSTHTKVNYKEVFPGEIYVFKAEYIIPQLLLQWVKQEGLTIDGIRYKSCTGDARFPKLTHDHYNYVLPVRGSLENGFCPSLTHLFATTPVYSYLSTTMETDISGFIQSIELDLKKAVCTQLTDTSVR
ncbi:MAG: hypothetical protein Q8L07_14995 [Sediminibacterium sp.]|nr:hypothetical protein [Sediminibacterium sp.]